MAKANKDSSNERLTAEDLAKKQREISVAEFFEKNRHLLGFDNTRKALLTAIKEAVDNSLDACEESKILPEISVEIIEMSESRFRIIIEDNGPGIVKEQIPKIFAKLLYGSKFHRLKQQRGQQGIGISAAVMYAQLTTGRPTKIISKTDPKKQAHYMELHLNTQTNNPEIMVDEIKEWKKDHGTRIEMDLEGSYLKGNQSVDEYLRQTAIINPHATIIYTNPKAEQFIYARATEALPKEPLEIKPHPYGLELGILAKMLKNTESRTLQSFLINDLSRVGSGTAKEICDNALIYPKKKPQDMSMQDAEKLINAIKNTKIMAPTTDCLSPIGEEFLEKSLKKEINAEFYCAITRPIFVYRGNPFQIEVGLAYGGNQPKEESVSLLRFANRVPLLYQQGACAITKSIVTTNWKAYGLQQSNNSMPSGPLTIIVHMSSVWVPFTSESKEALAHYPEIIKEIKLALQEAGRKLQTYVHKKYKVQNQLERANLFEKYMPEVADSLSRLTGDNKELLLKKLQDMIKKDEIQREIHDLESLKGEDDERTKKQDDEEVEE
ncbi:TPA: DNA topoisomerase VI subunit B [Candidatus Woesearchaeota archaeon]|nr:DNA topoisomerase VI subunit B [Candidatus Woesearchaeota archaeon]HIH31694.1 DNA topoisomerase VI subunit B [Candidatus Woesearchaeota archaeon]HIH54957.1 DNA topoisomerase VI subunit B [Candidatus Woesearchaeota archaeon]HIJ02650.1 DNA topoisomerase VI subunit B [Candidatus Woesearchaeota archaeon]HIJ13612.1 DNA topoisomerase VI subunit B [Candidatus Woesearchaeota archaeon]